jgi:hypothetical protein
MLSSGDVIAALGAMAHPIKLITCRADYGMSLADGGWGKPWVSSPRPWPSSLNGQGGQDEGSFVVFEAEQRPTLPHRARRRMGDQCENMSTAVAGSLPPRN